MKKSQEILSSIVQRFPEHWGAIARLFQEESEFANICRDYNDAERLLLQLTQSGKAENKDRISEVGTIIRELEIEILDAIDARDNAPVFKKVQR